MLNQTLNKLSSIIDSQLDRYNYSLSRYMNDVTVDIRSSMDYDNYYGRFGYGFAKRQDQDLHQMAYTNVIKSCIDTLVSKISTNKARPYFSTINGSYKSKRIAKQAQKFFDQVYSDQKVYEKITQAYRDSCIFSTGYIFINPFDYSIRTLPPWTVGIRNSEAGYGEPVEMLIKYNNYPVSLLDEKDRKNIHTDYVQYCMAISCIEKKADIYINGKVVKTIQYKANTIPIVQLFYTKPVFGTRTSSLIDDLDGIQTQIDLINTKLSAASELTPANTTYVLEGSNLKTSDVNNRTGNVYGVKLPPGLSQLPVVNVSPTPFDPSWQNLLEYYVKQAYEMTGISQLSAMSKKPSGLDSGVALSTMEDIESDRFQVQLNQFVHCFVDIAKKMIEVIPEEANIVPTTLTSSSYKWKDLKDESKMFNIQYSASSALSNDPSERLKQIMQMSQIGLIGIDKIALYLDSPDLEDAYSDAQAVMNAISKVIDNAIENDEYAIPDYITHSALAKQIAIVENQLYSSITNEDEENDKYVRQSLARVSTLEDVLYDIMQENGEVADNSPMNGAMISSGGIGATGMNPALVPNTNNTGAVNEGVNNSAPESNGADETGQEAGALNTEGGEGQPGLPVSPNAG